MLFFKDISNFYNTTDYLPILNAAIIVDLIVIMMLKIGYIKSKVLQTWYNKFHLGAFMADVLSLMIGVIITRFIYTYFGLKWSIILFLCIAVLVQLCHDLLFAKLFYAIPRGINVVLDVFKDYANELGGKILVADAQMIIGTVLLASLLANKKFNTNIIIFIVISYIVPYLLFSV